jgi:hypothetical protein
MIKDWSVKEIKAQVDKIAWAESDPRMDGYVTWGCKEDLYSLYWYIEDKLKNCSTYSTVEEDLLERRRERLIVQKLGGDLEDQ